MALRESWNSGMYGDKQHPHSLEQKWSHNQASRDGNTSRIRRRSPGIPASSQQAHCQNPGDMLHTDTILTPIQPTDQWIHMPSLLGVSLGSLYSNSHCYSCLFPSLLLLTSIKEYLTVKMTICMPIGQSFYITKVYWLIVSIPTNYPWSGDWVCSCHEQCFSMESIMYAWLPKQRQVCQELPTKLYIELPYSL